MKKVQFKNDYNTVQKSMKNLREAQAKKIALMTAEEKEVYTRRQQ